MKFNSHKDQLYTLDDKIDLINVMRDFSLYQEDAFYICDVDDIIKKYEQWKVMLPRVTPYYAVKCNDNKLVLEILATIGLNFDCASKAEIQKVLQLGVDSSRIIFANPAKPASHIRYAATVNADLMTFDNEAELYKVKTLYPIARLILRIRSDANIAQCPLGIKYGCNPITEGPKLLQLARNLQLNVVGISFHVGSGCGEPIAYRRAIEAASLLFDVAAMLGFSMHILDIGGGFPGDKNARIESIAEVINEALNEYFPAENEINVVAEPGRFFVASAFTLLTNVHSKREMYDHQTKQVSDIMYYISDGIYGSFNSILYDHARPIPLPLHEVISEKKVPCSIWGPTCDGLDLVVENIVFPVLNIGDWIMFENMGAYTVAGATTFNGFPIPKIFPVIKESAMLILKNLHWSEDRFTMGNVFEPLKNLGYTESLNRNDFIKSNLWDNNSDSQTLFPEIFNFSGINGVMSN